MSRRQRTNQKIRGPKHHVQQSHAHRPPRIGRESQNRSEQPRVRHLLDRDSGSWKNKDGEYETRTEWHRVVAWRPRQVRRKPPEGQLITLEGTLKYREVEDTVKRMTFKHRIAEIHATSIKRLPKIEAAGDPADGADDE